MRAPAIVFVEPKRVEVWTMELPDLGPDDVGIRTVYSGVSQGTERWVLTGRYNHYGDDPAAFYPCCPGYQAAGIVDAVGENVNDLSEGDHVFVQGTRFADSSWKYPGPCLASHTGYLVTPRSAVTRLAPEVDLKGASLYHMASVSLHGARLANINPGELVVVIGQGMIGQMSAQAARLRGARVITADLIAQRVKLSALYSADRAVNASLEKLEDVVRAEAPKGADVVVDTTGDSRMFNRCLELVRREGRICLQGYYPDPIMIDFHSTHLKRPIVSFPCGWDDEMNQMLADHLETGRIQINSLVTHSVPFQDAARAYELVLEHPEQSLGMVIRWDGVE